MESIYFVNRTGSRKREFVAYLAELIKFVVGLSVCTQLCECQLLHRQPYMLFM